MLTDLMINLFLMTTVVGAPSGCSNPNSNPAKGHLLRKPVLHEVGSRSICDCECAEIFRRMAHNTVRLAVE